MELYGIKVSDEELFAMISEVDQNSNGVIDYSEYVEILLKAKERQVAMGASGDLSECCFPSFGVSGCLAPLFLPHIRVSILVMS